METKYTLEYFIEKFEGIPKEKWCEVDFTLGDKHCAYGHCGCHEKRTDTEEGTALSELTDGTYMFMGA